jgi:dienelactone hydrolase
MAAYTFLKSRPECTGKVGAVGFCFGGGVVNQMAVRFPDLAAGVPFYGGQASAADAAKIKAPLLLQYASTDERINAGGRRTRPRSRRTRSSTRRSSTRTRSTASTTTRRRGTTRPLRSLRGSERSRSSMRT